MSRGDQEPEKKGGEGRKARREKDEIGEGASDFVPTDPQGKLSAILIQVTLGTHQFLFHKYSLSTSCAGPCPQLWVAVGGRGPAGGKNGS